MELQVEADGTVRVTEEPPSTAPAPDSIAFRTVGSLRVDESGKSVPRRATPRLLSPYAFSGVSDKPVPPPKPGVFNVYSEDGTGAGVRVEFPLKTACP